MIRQRAEFVGHDAVHILQLADVAGQFVNDLVELPSSLYTISYKSALPTNFGKDYLPVEVEAYLLNRSGRAESGYFAPLE